MSGKKKILIFGGSGQDGVILSDLYTFSKFSVVAVGRKFRRPTNDYNSDIKRLNLDLLEIDVLDLLNFEKPDIVIYAAAYHGSSGIVYEETIEESFIVNVNVPTKILEYCKKNKSVKFAYFNSSKVFDYQTTKTIDEKSNRRPNCVYSLQKELTYKAIEYYRDKYNVLAFNFWLFNHESIYRAPSYFIPTIISTLRASLVDQEVKQKINTLDFYCDWGIAEDYMKMVKKILKMPMADDFILASGITLSGRELVGDLCETLGLDYKRHFFETNTPNRSQSVRWKVDVSKVKKIYKEDITSIKDFCLQQVME